MNLQYEEFISYLKKSQLYTDSYNVYKTSGKHALIIINRIFNLMNSNKYKSLDDLIKTSNYSEFLNVFGLYTPVKEHYWGADNHFNQDDFIDLIGNIKKYIQYKMNIENENTFPITGTLIYENKPIYPIFLNEINKEELSDDELAIYEYAVNYQIKNSTPIRVDIKSKVLIDKHNNIIKINLNNDISFNGNSKGYQKILTNNNYGGNIYGQSSESNDQSGEQPIKYANQ